jgi:hypothetical protein
VPWWMVKRVRRRPKMKLQVLDEEALSTPRPRDIRLYLRIHGWTRSDREEGQPDVWTLPIGDSAYEVIAPSSRGVLDYARRIRELLRTVSIAEDRSEFEVLSDLTTLTFDIQQVHLEHGGPPGTAPLRDASAAFTATQSMFSSVLSSFEERRLVLPSSRPPRATELLSRVLAGPATVGSYVISIWVPVPSLLRPDEDGVLFDPEEEGVSTEPYERAATRFLNSALNATRSAAIEALDGRVGPEPFVVRENEGVSANLCEALVNLSGQTDAPFDVHFAWALERPVQGLIPIVQFKSEMIPVLRVAAATLRAMIPEDIVTIRGNVVRLHRDSNYGAGEVSISGVVRGDETAKLRRVSVSLTEEDYRLAILAHSNFADVEVVGSLIQRGNRTYLTNPSNFLLHGSTDETGSWVTGLM